MMSPAPLVHAIAHLTTTAQPLNAIKGVAAALEGKWAQH
jgi:hypothetical protein